SFEAGKPALYVSEPDLIKLVLVRDFTSLSDRKPIKFGDPVLDNMMTAASLDRWRVIRAVASPAFSASKVKKKSEDYLKLLMDAREERHDTNGYPNRRETPERSALSEVEVLAQCVVMFLGGQDSISSLIAHTVYLLALHPDKQTKLREEVDRCFSSHGEEISPEVISKLDYLHGVVSEALRLFPPATRIDRSTTEDYALGDTGITLPKGCTITVPIYAMHRDPLNFIDPDSFIPERYSYILLLNE
ncbi:cytochrome P450 3A24-like, partial [Ixodes scapularis]